MLQPDRDKLRGTIALLDQAIAPLTNAEIALAEVFAREKDVLDGRVDIEEKDPDRFKQLVNLNNRYKSIHAMVDYLNETKIFLEKI